MFRRDHYHYHNHRSETTVRHGDQNIIVNENKAPTDDSIRILNEMQEKTFKNIMGKIEVPGNELSFKGAVHRDSMFANIIIEVIYNINQYERHVKITLSEREWKNYELSLEDISKRMSDEIVKDLAEFMGQYIIYNMQGELRSVR